MALTTIFANITDGSTALTGYIKYVLNYVVADGSLLAVPSPNTINLVSGQATFQMEPTDILGTTYHWEVHQVATDSTDTIYWSFDAAVPTSNDTVNFSQMAVQTGLANNIQDVSYLAISRALYNDEAFWNRLRTEVFVPSGSFSNTVYYQRGDVVSWMGSSYLCVNQAPIVGIYPTDTGNWQLLAGKGDTGTGTAGNDSAYDPTSWNGQLDAPSRNQVRDVFVTLATQSQLSGLAPLVSPALTGSPTINAQPVATQTFVASTYAPLASPALTGVPSSPTPPNSDNSQKIANTAWVTQALNNYALLSAFGLTTSTGQIAYKAQGILIKAGTTTGSTDASGIFTVSYNTAFPATLYTVIAVNGDSSATTVAPGVVVSSLSLNSFQVKFNGVASTPVRVNWIAFGI